MFYPTPGGTNDGTSAPLNVVINEWMASNTRTLANPWNGNKFDDWFEIYNPGADPANLEGFYLTDTLANKTQYRIPAGYVVPPRRLSNGLGRWRREPQCHQSAGAACFLSALQIRRSHRPLRGGWPFDRSVTFGPQTNDVAQGRFPDGAASIYYLSTPTPTNANVYFFPNATPQLAPIPNYTNYPGSAVSFSAFAIDTDQPAQTLSFSLDAGAPAGAVVNSVSGAFSWAIPANTPASTNNITLRVTDSGTPSRSAAQTSACSSSSPCASPPCK